MKFSAVLLSAAFAGVALAQGSGITIGGQPADSLDSNDSGDGITVGDGQSQGNSGDSNDSSDGITINGESPDSPGNTSGPGNGGGITNQSGSNSGCPDAKGTFQNQDYCCPGPIRADGDSAYCCVGAPLVDERPCFPFCTDSTTYSCSTTIPVTASDYSALALTSYLHSTYGAQFTGSAAAGSSAGTTATSSNSGDQPEDTGSPSTQGGSAPSAQGGSAPSPSSTGGAAMITQAPIALGAAAMMALAAL